MKFLVDENVGTTIVFYLRSTRHNVYWIKEMEPGMPDLAILKLAFRSKRILITYDQDFGELVFAQGIRHCGVLLLRLGIDTPNIHIKALKKFLAAHSQKEIAGSFWKIDERYL